MSFTVLDKDRAPEKTVAEYFAGIGLVRMGLEASGWRVVFANDFDPRKYEMYLGFYANAADHYLVEDVFKVRVEEIPSALIATCSFPCIDLSLAGNMNGLNGRHSSAFWGFINILRKQETQAPPLVLIENVPGWLSSNNGDDFRVAVKALNELGYICDVFVLNALRFVPQSRERVFLIGAKCRNPLDSLERLLNRPPSLLSRRLRKAIQANLGLKWTYIDMPEPPPLKTTGLSEVIEELDDDDKRWWPRDEVDRHLEMMALAHRSRVEEFKQGVTPTYRTFYRRVRHGQQRAEVRDDDIAGCLRTAVGGSSRQFVVMAGLGKIKMRAMTSREYANLQGVPLEFAINVDERQAINGLGDAVCVPAISWIAEHALSKLAAETAQAEPLIHPAP
jgi:DNA (cytosine-5)-methyltransferase 1